MSASPYQNTFDAEAWGRIYDGPTPDAAQLVFRRGMEVALRACLNRSHPGELWLDVGCGTGHLAAKLGCHGLRMTGIDHDANMIAAATRRFPQLAFTVARAEDLPFAGGALDGVLAVSVMGCLPSPRPFFREAMRVLRKAGILVLTCTNRRSIILRLNERLRREPSGSYHLYTAAEIGMELRSLGFEVLDVAYYNLFLNAGKLIIPPLSVALWVEGLPRLPWCRLLARNFLIVARKPRGQC
jgi:ubiquinone/menaquinone biosynthesis C-methylase UbiE